MRGPRKVLPLRALRASLEPFGLLMVKSSARSACVSSSLRRMVGLWVTRCRLASVCLLALFCLALGSSVSVQASETGASAPMSSTAGPHQLTVYVREGCPHCAEAKRYMPILQRARMDVRVVLQPVDESAAARDELHRLSREAGYWPPGVPTFAYRGQLMVGFGEAEVSGPELQRWLADVDAALALPAPLSASASSPGVSVPATMQGWSGELARLQNWGLPLFTLMIGVIDGFNPCAMWVLLFLLSLLVHLRDRRRMALIAGTFVLVSGAVYYAFMAAWLNLFQAVGLTGPVRVALACLALLIAAVNIKDYVVGRRGVSLSIPERAKPTLYRRMRGVMQAHSLPFAMLGVASLAVAVNLVELLCTAGLPAMYTAILTQQELSPAQHYGYLGLYIMGYIADDSLMVGTAGYALAHDKLSEQAGRRLKLISGVVMAVLGLVMLLRPDWLT